MTDNSTKIDQLLNKLDTLLNKQETFKQEIDTLSSEIRSLKKEPVLADKEPIKQEEAELPKEQVSARQPTPQKTEILQPIKPKTPKIQESESNIEKFIGENLINKIGIAITVIGIAIGAKYAIDNDLISPLTRIILGYLFGLGLMGFAIKLKKNYENFSAVLLSGSMAIMYFITFAAYDFYDLIPQSMTFALMFIFTAFTVIAALQYNQQVIAHIGLVGAYAVPFLLSDGSGRIAVLFSYMAIINVGILIIALKKHWKPLHYASFILTWLIYSIWYGLTPMYGVASDGVAIYNFDVASIFLTLFFAIFYITFLVYKLIRKEQFEVEQVSLLLANSFIFFGFGYSILNSHPTGEYLLGIFTLVNAIIHFTVSIVVYRKKLVAPNLFFLISGLVLVFLTITMPIQLDGNWVTLIWAGEAALLFWIGRTKNVKMYENFSYPIMFLAFFSICHDWANVRYNSTTFLATRIESITFIKPLFNINFLSEMLFVGAFAFINILNNSKKYVNRFNAENNPIFQIVKYSIPTILLIVLYNSFRIEIIVYWNQLMILELKGEFTTYLKHFKTIWLINYSMLFFTILSFVNIKKIKDQQLTFISLGINALVLIIFLTFGLYAISELREYYLDLERETYYGIYNIAIRYIAIAFVGELIFACYKYVKQEFIKPILREVFDFVFYGSLLWILSSELLSWLDIGGLTETTESYKLGLSILWGSYSLMMIVVGIIKRRKHIRIGAIIVFGVTLLKLFLYDISHLETIAKTIVFVALGVLLLIISFLYNKYKQTIFDDDAE